MRLINYFGQSVDVTETVLANIDHDYRGVLDVGQVLVVDDFNCPDSFYNCAD